MRRRIFVRPGYSVPVLLLISLVIVGYVAFSAMAVSSDLPGAAFNASSALLAAFGGWVVWQRAQVLVSDRGVRVGLFSRRWLAWPEINGLRREENLNRANPTSRLIVAEMVSGGSVIVCGVPFMPILFDSLERHDRAVKRVLE